MLFNRVALSRVLPALLSFCFLAACQVDSEALSGADSGEDAGVADVRASDASDTEEVGGADDVVDVALDARPDATEPDASADAGESDAGEADASNPDGGADVDEDGEASDAGDGDNDTDERDADDVNDANDANDADDAEDDMGWPEVRSSIDSDPAIEAAIRALIDEMSVEQKVGQMIQPEIQSITPDEVRRYHIGSVLNGGGSWPSGNKRASASDWVALADAYYDASMDTSDGALAIPVIWGTDAVHGHSNVFGATIFPHNIGLGAANNPGLIERIAQATALEVQATGIDWTFAPTLAVVRDDRWGRTYEGYAETPEIVEAYAAAMTVGLQGAAGASDLLDTSRVVATAKHFLGDGGTTDGVDQGDTALDEEALIRTHAPGYFAAIEAGVQTIMASFSSWNGAKMHGNGYLLTDVLRGPLGFDGLVVGDWNGHGQLPDCTDESCPAAILAGVDLIMVPWAWRAFHENTVRQVNEGTIPMERIDEAVRRILRVKMRAGLLGPHADRGRPSTRPHAGDVGLLGSPAHRALAREAVQQSLVVLKNDANPLPLDAGTRVFVAGKAADSLELQTGGWTLSWQGTGNPNTDFPNGESIFEGIQTRVEAGGGSATLDVSGESASDAYDAIVAVIGERPYAEGQGDLRPTDTLSHSRRYAEDAALLARLRERAPGVPIVTVFVSGRPAYVNPELNLSDAFVVAWLPGSEGGGVADVLFGDAPATGRLSFSWPASPCDTAANADLPERETAPLFAYGYGLSLDDTTALGASLPEEIVPLGCGVDPSDPADVPLELFTGGSDRGDWVLRIGAPSNWGGVDVGTAANLPGEIEVSSVDGLVQGSARRVRWTSIGEIYTDIGRRLPGENLSAYAGTAAELAFRVRVHSVEASAAAIVAHCEWPCRGEFSILDRLRAIDDGAWHELRIPIDCFVGAGLDISDVNRPFLLYAEGAMELDLEEIRWEPGTAPAPVDCSAWR